MGEKESPASEWLTELVNVASVLSGVRLSVGRMLTQPRGRQEREQARRLFVALGEAEDRAANALAIALEVDNV